MKLKKSDIGRWITVKWDDIGRTDCLLVEINNEGRKYAKIFTPYKGLCSIDQSQITELRSYVNAK